MRLRIDLKLHQPLLNLRKLLILLLKLIPLQLRFPKNTPISTMNQSSTSSSNFPSARSYIASYDTDSSNRTNCPMTGNATGLSGGAGLFQLLGYGCLRLFLSLSGRAVLRSDGCGRGLMVRSVGTVWVSCCGFRGFFSCGMCRIVFGGTAGSAGGAASHFYSCLYY